MMINHVNDVGIVVREARVKMMMTQTELARKLDRAQTSICNIEKAKEVPSIKSILAIAKALGLELYISMRAPITEDLYQEAEEEGEV